MKAGDLVRFKRYKGFPTELGLIVGTAGRFDVFKALWNGEIRSIHVNRLFSKAVSESR